MSAYMDLKGTSESSFNVGLSSLAVKLKSTSGDLHFRNKSDSVFINIQANNITGNILTVDEARINGNIIELNYDATDLGADFKMTFARPISGMSAGVTYTFPAVPTNGYFLTTDAVGNLSWATVSTPAVADKVLLVEQPFNFFGAFGPSVIAVDFQFTVAGQRIVKVEVAVVDAFDGSVNTIEIVKDPGGVAEETLMSTSQSDLTDQNTLFVVEPVNSSTASQQVVAFLTATSATIGSGFIRIYAAIPNTLFT